MARSRNLKPSFFTNVELSKLKHGARLLYQGLWVIADREGRLKDCPEWIKAHAFPYERVPVDRWLDDLAASGFIVRYEAGGGRFIQIITFLKHQTPHVKEPASTIPEPDLSQSGISTVCHSIERGKREEGINKRESDRARGTFEPPSVEQVAAYCAERGNRIDPEEFVAFYASKGWKVGKNAMKDWQSAIVTWEKNQGRFNGKHATAQRPRAIRSIADDPS